MQTVRTSSGVSSAAAFVAARRAGQRLDAYPGAKPTDLAAAYAIQDEAIGLWNEPIGGWKVGRINSPWVDLLGGGDRLVGPIFETQICTAAGDLAAMPVFAGGFAAVEGEFVVILGEDAPAHKSEWSEPEMRELIGAVHMGVEVASSPYSLINDDGPLVTISDFGNNAGLLLGGEYPNWRAFAFEQWRVEARIDGALVGSGAAHELPGGLFASFGAALSICAARGLPLRKGMAISTGAISGVHEARIGQIAEIAFAGAEILRCRLAAAGAGR